MMQSSARVLVVGGGKQRDTLNKNFALPPDSLTYIDVDISSDVDFICDAHDLPFKSETFDAVVTTAVLEHVIRPEVVVQEMARVLKPQGAIYSELPFMQQVHEGAYDFSRFSLVGHRKLLAQFSILDMGLVAGPGTSLVWAIEALVVSFAVGDRSKSLLKFISRLMFFWIKYFDFLLTRSPSAVDGASCTFFFGKKLPSTVSDQEVIDSYRGSQKISHT